MTTRDQQDPPDGTKPEKAAKKKTQGIVYLKAERCKGCGFCIEFCPAHVLAFAQGFNPQGYHPPHLIDPEGCTGCNLCGMYCPDFAIHAVMMKYDGQTLRPTTKDDGGAKR
jgi:2-oxoglutarate ferredoxin oxidoreductase subunit delta